ncbi:aminotransferase class V-fold PLP-dependent enzyme [Novosphingobium sp. 1949]|uniref:Aminotransferase class V-fold PLP-dependent enzyme n=1 Tax=Novosphingobium organovorum TaxID=2930092 RepID=A0ABT0BEP7_9SPHN|nr:aminotransferase class V-fold PLP-dependent enzyme [Novosphingobium organovorum]MCJ2183546.1 aminotransferase class V-fold PLP-dependent enzyme [Novosphingobium organovorum]
MENRRQFIAGAGLASLAVTLGAGAAGAASVAPLAPGKVDFTALDSPLDGLYDVDRSIANFDAAYYGAMTRPIHAAYLDRVAFVNRENSLFLRSALKDHPRDAEIDRSRVAVAGLLGCTPDEIALAGGGTEALYALIVNYRLLRPGDAVIHADVDYDEMQYAMDYLEEMRGAKVVRFALPEPHTEANILAAYEKVLRETPRAKLLLLTHVSNRNGLIPPVRKIVAMAKARGVDVILDSAQAVGQLPFTVEDTGADFIGFSLHKWLAAPLGTGGIYIRKERLGDIAPFLGNRIYAEDDIRARILSGTVDFAARLTVRDAVALHEAIGGEAKFARLLALRNYWVERVRDVPGLEILVPEEAGRYGAITAFRLSGMGTDYARYQRAQALFRDKYALQVVAKAGLASGPGLRVTPALFNTTAELDRLVTAIRAERAMFA